MSTDLQQRPRLLHLRGDTFSARQRFSAGAGFARKFRG